MKLAIFDKFTPRAYPKTRLLTAAHVWSGVGLFLASKGIYLSYEEPLPYLAAAISAGLVLGIVKSHYIFDKVADKIITHIRRRPSRVCLGGLFSLKNWALIITMMLFGRFLGAASLEAPYKTTIYVMVGSGLAFSSRRLWGAWKKTLPIALQDLRR